MWYEDEDDIPEEKPEVPVKPNRDFYIYAHSNKNSEVLFLGVGRGDLWFSRRGRSKRHKAALMTNEITSMSIVSNHTTEDAAKQALRRLIKKHTPRLNEPTPTAEYDYRTNSWKTTDLPTQFSLELRKPLNETYRQLIPALETFFDSQAGRRKKDKQVFSLKRGTEWGDRLYDVRGDTLRNLKRAKWFTDFLDFHGYHVVSVKGRTGGTIIAPK